MQKRDSTVRRYSVRRSSACQAERLSKGEAAPWKLNSAHRSRIVNDRWLVYTGRTQPV